MECGIYADIYMFCSFKVLYATLIKVVERELNMVKILKHNYCYLIFGILTSMKNVDSLHRIIRENVSGGSTGRIVRIKSGKIKNHIIFGYVKRPNSI